MTLPTPQSTRSQSTNPYVGPRTFTEQEGRFFFGREREARDLTARIVSERLLLFYAQSGAGKSSLLNARVIPKLRDEERFQVLPVGRVSGELPAGIDAVANIFAFNLMASLDQSAAPPARLAQATLSDFLARLARETATGAAGQPATRWIYRPELAPAPAAAAGARPAAGPRFALVIDQFEEIITGHPDRWREREGFFRQLNQALLDDPNLWVVLSLREDYVASLDPYAELCLNRLRARFYMERMSVAAALDAVRKPAELAVRPFTAGVAEKLVDDLRQVRVAGQETTVPGQYVEPVQLQVVCYQLWEGVTQGDEGRRTNDEGRTTTDDRRFITAEDLAVAGDVDRALTQFYEETLAAALADPAAAGVSERQLRAWFDEALITQEGTRGLVHQGEADAGGLPNAAVRALQRRFLVRGEARGGDTWIELVHDRFVEPIRRSNRAWFDRNLNPLTFDAQAWQEAGKPEARLYSGSQLTAAAAQLRANPAAFGELERGFVEAGHQAETRRVVRRQRDIFLVASVLLAVFIALAAWALWSRGQIQVEARRAATAEARAIAQKGTAEAASAAAAVALAAAQAANTAQVQTMNDLAVALQVNLTAYAGAAQSSYPVTPPAPPTLTPTPPPPTLSPSPLPPGATPRPTAAVTAPPSPRPTATATPRSTPTPLFTAVNPLVVAQQTQLAAVRITQTALAAACRLATGATFARAWDRGRIGCPTAAEAAVTTAYEPFERGWMLWRKDTDKIYVFFDGGELRIYTLPEARPEFTCQDAQNLGNPRLGFGKVWCDNADVRSRIGNPTAAEIGGDRRLQEFERGFMIYVNEQGKAISAYSAGQWTGAGAGF